MTAMLKAKTLQGNVFVVLLGLLHVQASSTGDRGFSIVVEGGGYCPHLDSLNPKSPVLIEGSGLLITRTASASWNVTINMKNPKNDCHVFSLLKAIL